MYSFIHCRPQIFIDFFHRVCCYCCCCSLPRDDVVCLLACFLRLSSDFSILTDMEVIGKSYYPTATPHDLGQQKSEDIFKDTWFKQYELPRVPIADKF